MDPITALSQTFDHTHRLISGVRADQMGDTTPCSEWDVATLLTHTIGVVSGIASALNGSPSTSSIKDFQLGDDAAAQFRHEADVNLAAWRAAGLEGETNIGAGPMPKQAAIGINLLDTATHSWDIARATGQPDELPTELAAMILGICQGFVTDEIRQGAGFLPPVPVPDAASPTAQLVAFLGRRP